MSVTPIDCPYKADGETTLRCAKCERPLMVKDAQRTPVGYVCPYYVKARVATFYTAGMEHYVIATLIALVGGVISGFALRLASSIGFFSFILMTFIGPAIGGVIAEAIRRVVKKNRGQYMWLTCGIAVVIGAAYFLIAPLLFGLSRGAAGSLLFELIPLYGLFLVVSTLAARLRV